MDALVKINTDNEGRKVVSARELYEKLGLNVTNWKRWYKKNITENPFAVEGEDWVGFVIMTSGNETQDFAITIQFAKRLSMMARTETGESIRKYFVMVEEKAIEEKKSLTPAQMFFQNAQVLISLEQAQLQLQKKQIEIESKVETLIREKEEARNELLTLPLSTGVVPEISTKDKVRLLVNRYSMSIGMFQKAVWDKVYSELYYRYRISPNAFSDVRSGKVSKLESLDKKGHIEKVYAIISDMCRSINLSVA
jgi:anti-repressor protein